jgi:Cd2+/Zn2+-exporting ATPase
MSAGASDNAIARVMKMVEQARESKAPTERFIDRFSRYYTPGVVAVAGFVVLMPPLLFGGEWDAWVYKGLAILLIGCPCALVISTPAAIAASLPAGARRGRLLKGGAVLEVIGRITVATFDKTGTLTEGRPKVTDVIGFGNSEADVVRLAAALETGSSHPLAMAILARAKADDISPPGTVGGEAIGGKGVTGVVEGVAIFLGLPSAAAGRTRIVPEQTARIKALNTDRKSVAVLIAGDTVTGIIAMRDEPRADGKAGLKPWPMPAFARSC